MEQEMKKKNRGEMRELVDNEKWVYDSSLDHKGQVPLRASTGVWKAALFIIAIEFSERTNYFGLAGNLISYLTKVMHQDLKTAAKNVNYWAGVTTMMPLIGGFVADAYTGRFSMILLSSVLYLMGLGLLTMSQFIPSLKPCSTQFCTKPRKVHEVVFYLAIYLISLGTGGHKPCLESFGADQFDDDHPEERKQKMSYFNWWNFALCCGLLVGVTLIVYLQDNDGWGIAILILTITMAIAIVIFCFGMPFYRYRVPKGSPLTPMLQVLVAAIRKRNLDCPPSSALLYEVPKSYESHGRLLCHTNKLRFLDKAAIIEDNDNIGTGKQPNPWRLTTVTRVEETKLVINMVPIWLTSLTFGICVAQFSTFFVKQSSTMNRKIGENFEIPPASIHTVSALAMIVSVTVYEKILVPALRKVTGNERGIKILQRIGIGMAFSAVAMVVAALVETKRLGVAKREGRIGSTTLLSMSVFWLAPQLVVLGIGDAFIIVGLQEYFYDQVPDSMRSLGIAFYLTVMGLGSFISSFLITIVNHVTQKSSGASWFGKDLNESRLDNFYWLLAVLSGLGLCLFVLIAKRYEYKSTQRSVIAAADDHFHESNGGIESMA